jgi:hypothetical protein
VDVAGEATLQRAELATGGTIFWTVVDALPGPW